MPVAVQEKWSLERGGEDSEASAPDHLSALAEHLRESNNIIPRSGLCECVWTWVVLDFFVVVVCLWFVVGGLGWFFLRNHFQSSCDTFGQVAHPYCHCSITSPTVKFEGCGIHATYFLALILLILK